MSNWAGMDWLLQFFAPLGAYPRWFVIICVGLVAVGALWLVAKLIKWTIHLVVLCLVVGLVLFVAAWLLG